MKSSYTDKQAEQQSQWTRQVFYNHSGADLAKIIGATNEFASNNPGITHSTFIVSFQTRMVTQLLVQGGRVSVIEKGVISKRAK